MKFDRNVRQVHTHRLTESDFGHDVILARWRPWRYLVQSIAATSIHAHSRPTWSMVDSYLLGLGYCYFYRRRWIKRLSMAACSMNRLYKSLHSSQATAWSPGNTILLCIPWVKKPSFTKRRLILKINSFTVNTWHWICRNAITKNPPNFKRVDKQFAKISVKICTDQKDGNGR